MYSKTHIIIRTYNYNVQRNSAILINILILLFPVSWSIQAYHATICKYLKEFAKKNVIIIQINIK